VQINVTYQPQSADVGPQLLVISSMQLVDDVRHLFMAVVMATPTTLTILKSVSSRANSLCHQVYESVKFFSDDVDQRLYEVGVQ
jgi:hypothetical protein